ncbi:hypothetical protein MA04_02280 [Alcanivorax balearicus MACL04]|uniref:DUF4190 domain-containing protein n=1 Tax=Alloalcanivorax balearicus MACL04 TaxID=1177182 RepID=A0ABT2QZM4_9GAMM|nr:hypothetical protein [Alloalcanivorax balearicus]MCU5782980.1 hypothetical protein [Alloalcanivorax balearicus MACL04]
MTQPDRGGPLLVLAVVSLLLFVPLGPVVWWWAHRDLKAMAEGRMDPIGRPFTLWARGLSIAATLLLVMMLIGILIALISMG